jgi:hypothetical protein
MNTHSRCKTLAVLLLLATVVVGGLLQGLSISRYSPYLLSFTIPKGAAADLGLPAPENSPSDYVTLRNIFDETANGYVYANMAKGLHALLASGTLELGSWPTLGQAISIASRGRPFHVPPLYHYLVFFLGGFLGPHPTFYVLAETILSVLTGPLLSFLLYRMLSGIERDKRLLLSALAGLWHSVLFVNLFYASYGANFSQIPFFVFLFVLLFDRQMSREAVRPSQVLSWSAYGIVFALLISLHATALLVMPGIFAGCCLLFVYKHHRQPMSYCMVGVAVLFAALALAPYWAGEVSRQWANSRTILGFLSFESGPISVTTFLDRLLGSLLTSLDLGRQVYVLGTPRALVVLSSGVMTAAVVLALTRFRGNRMILGQLVVIWGGFLAAAMCYRDPRSILMHWKMLIVYCPVVCTITAMAYADYGRLGGKICVWLLGCFMVVSIWANMRYDTNFLYYKFAKERMFTVNDAVDVLKRLPEGTRVCPFWYDWLSRVKFHPFKYIDRYIVQRGFTFVPLGECGPGCYLVEPKLVWENVDGTLAFKVIRNEEFAKVRKRLVFETPSVDVFVRE